MRIRDTVVESRYFVMPVDTNSIGTLHGGRMIYWMVSTAMLACVRFGRGEAVLGALDSLFFLNPVKLGSMVVVKAWIEYAGRASMEAGVLAYSVDLLKKVVKPTTTSHMSFVGVDSSGRPRQLPYSISPGPDEEKIYELACKRYEERKKILGERDKMGLDVAEYAPDARYRMKSSYVVTMADAPFGGLMFGGRLLRILDEMAGALGTRYCGDVVVTASLDSTYFLNPIRYGMIIDVETALTYVGRSSAEIAVKVLTENPVSGVRRHAATTFFTMVRVDGEGNTVPMPEYIPQSEGEKKRVEEAMVRRNKRMELRRVAEEVEKLHRGLVSYDF
jgi:acyl-CoA hydrolase